VADHPGPVDVSPPSGSDPGALLEVALDAALAAAELITTGRPEDLEAETKSSPTDLVTVVDRRAEDLVAERIRRRRPRDRIVGEERGGPAVDGTVDPPVTWWVDPIDGTTNYVYDHPGYAVSVAAQVDGRIVAGVVADPTHARVHRATLGGGAFCDDERTGRTTRLELGEPPPLDRALVATGFSYLPEVRTTQARVLAALIGRIRDVRRVGAASLDLCAVAAGRVDAYFEAGLETWDFAAGGLIATEAGARLCGLDGGPVRPGSVLCAQPVLAEQLLEALASIDPT
jgi:myo-inositol-1(or 4)-monophosphatase